MSLDVMMPFYGDPSLFRAAVDSVVQQTSSQWHLTVIDDCYPDREPGEWLVGPKDPRITYVRNAENLGVTGNFQRAIELSSAEHVVIMGCDDLMLPDYVRHAESLIDRFPDASYFQPGVEVIDAQGQPALPLADRLKARLRPRFDGVRELRGEDLVAGLLRGNWTYFPSICWRRIDLVQRGFRSEFEVALDLALQLEILMDGGSLVTSPQTTFRYRRHAASVSSWKASDGTRFAEEAALFAQVRRQATALGWTKAAHAARVHWTSRMNAVMNLAGALGHGDMAGVRALLKHAFG